MFVWPPMELIGTIPVHCRLLHKRNLPAGHPARLAGRAEGRAEAVLAAPGPGRAARGRRAATGRPPGAVAGARLVIRAQILHLFLGVVFRRCAMHLALTNLRTVAASNSTASGLRVLTPVLAFRTLPLVLRGHRVLSVAQLYKP